VSIIGLYDYGGGSAVGDPLVPSLLVFAVQRY
jgi:hypothetical protein